MKTCTRCGVEKPLGDFYFQRDRQQYRTTCRECKSLYQKRYRIINKSNISKQVTEYRRRNKNDISSQRKKYYQRTKEERIKYSKDYRSINREQVNERNIIQGRLPASFDTYGHRLVSSDNATSDDDVLLVDCKYCGKQHSPCRTAVMSRIRCLEGKEDGESNFYCSDECRNSCVLFNFHTNHIDPRSKQYIPPSEQQTARSCQTDDLKQLQCDTHGHNYCERCGDIIDVELHHTLTVAQHGTDAVSSAGHILLCAGCHMEVHGECV